MNAYFIGQAVEIDATFYASAGVPTDTTPAIKIRKPDGTISTLSTLHPGTGSYTATVTVDQAGEWFYQVLGTGGVVAAAESSFMVNPTKF